MRYMNSFYLLCAVALMLLISAGVRAQSVTGFTLINAETDAPVVAFDPLAGGAVLDPDGLPTSSLNIRANTSGTVSKVVFGLDGNASYRSESAAPYVLAGDKDGNYNAWTPAPGSHTVTATAYGADGSAGGGMTVTFSVNRGGGSVGGDPVVSAGSDRMLILPENSVTLAGSAGDPGGSITSYAWTKESGPAAAMSGAASASLVLSGLVEGTYVFRLTATDNEDNTAYDEAAVAVYAAGAAGGAVSGELKMWHKVSVTFSGPATAEDATPNPFTDYRLNVTFTNGSRTFIVPGYYAADGDAAETSADSGNKWRVNFCPDATGTWNYAASFRTGAEVAVDPDPLAGTATAFNGATGSFIVGASDKTGRDHRGKGRLQYVGQRYLRFAGTGEYFIKQGADSPENLFAYDDFDGNFKSDGIEDGRIKSWSAHAGDWNTGDPVWQGDKGKEVIGAVNYLASEGLNAFSFLTMNIGGDDKNVFPYTSYTERLRMDCSKLDQWEIILAHGDRMGMYLHFKTQETENDQLLDGGALGPQRKLYYRELIARFGHHLALNWNLGEENTNTDAQRKAFAQYFYDHDPYRHNVVLHTYPHQKNTVYTPLLGDASELTGLSMQFDQSTFVDIPPVVIEWVKKSTAAGKPWVVAVDEPGDAASALLPDSNPRESHDNARKYGVWGTFMGGGAGTEWYFGWNGDHSDLTCEDYRSRDSFWDYCRHALAFFNDNDVPFWTMVNHNELTARPGNYCFAKPGSVYVVYLTAGGSASLTVAEGEYTVKWYDPRNGGSLQDGSVGSLSGSGVKDLGAPPSSANLDWAVLVTAAGSDGSGGTDTTVTPPAGTGAFIEQDGLLVFEMESAPIAAGWSKETALTGYTGDGYYVCDGNLMTNASGTVEIPIKITTPGTYMFSLRNRHDYPDRTEENDCFTRMDNGPWVKTFSHVRGVWTWDTGHDVNHVFTKPPRYELSAGYHTFYISTRSLDFAIDRVHFYQSSVTGPLSVAHPESPREGGVSVISPNTAAAVPGAVVSCFPNPMTDRARLSFNGAGGGAYRLTVHDRDGRTRYTHAGSGAAAATVWNAAGVPAGAYIIRLQTRQGETVRRVLKVEP